MNTIPNQPASFTTAPMIPLDQAWNYRAAAPMCEASYLAGASDEMAKGNEEQHRLRLVLAETRDDLSTMTKKRDIWRSGCIRRAGELRQAHADIQVGNDLLRKSAQGFRNVSAERDSYKEAWDGAQDRLLAYDDQVRNLQRLNDNQSRLLHQAWAQRDELRKTVGDLTADCKSYARHS